MKNCLVCGTHIEKHKRLCEMCRTQKRRERDKVRGKKYRERKRLLKPFKNCAECNKIMLISKKRFCNDCSLKHKRESDKNRQQQRRQSLEYRKQYRNYSRQKRYGLTQEQFNQLFIKQNRCCAICNRTNPGWNKDWHVDHSHDIGKVRGILCQACNLLLGMAHDDSKILLLASNYLENNKQKNKG